MESPLVDFLTLGVEAVVTFTAVYAAYRLAIRQDRAKERDEFTASREAQLRLFKTDLERMQTMLSETQDYPSERIYGDAWDAAKFTGRLSTLTEKEFTVLSDVYMTAKSLNDIFEEPPHTLDLRTLRITMRRRELSNKITEARRLLIESNAVQQNPAG